jgi:hypothetical protein
MKYTFLVENDAPFDSSIVDAKWYVVRVSQDNREETIGTAASSNEAHQMLNQELKKYTKGEDGFFTPKSI